MIFCLVAVTLTLSAPVPAAGKDPLDALKGEWLVIDAEVFGRPDELHVGETLRFDGDRLTHEAAGGSLKYRLQVEPKAGWIDWRPDGKGDVPWSRRGVYKVSGDTLTLCVASPLAEGDRATAFRTKAGRSSGDAAGTVLLILKRKKK